MSANFVAVQICLWVLLLGRALQLFHGFEHELQQLRLMLALSLSDGWTRTPIRDDGLGVRGGEAECRKARLRL